MLYLAAILGGTGALAVAILLWRLSVAKGEAAAATRERDEEREGRIKAEVYATRVNGENHVLRREAESGRKRWAALTRAHPGIAHDVFYGVLEDTAAALPDTAGDEPASVPGKRNP